MGVGNPKPYPTLHFVDTLNLGHVGGGGRGGGGGGGGGGGEGGKRGRGEGEREGRGDGEREGRGDGNTGLSSTSLSFFSSFRWWLFHVV